MGVSTASGKATISKVVRTPGGYYMAQWTDGGRFGGVRAEGPELGSEAEAEKCIAILDRMIRDIAAQRPNPNAGGGVPKNRVVMRDDCYNRTLYTDCWRTGKTFNVIVAGGAGDYAVTHDKLKREHKTLFRAECEVLEKDCMIWNACRVAVNENRKANRKASRK